MNPLAMKLTGPPRSLADLADLIEKHIGEGADETRCKEALDALRLVRAEHASYYFRVALRHLDAEGTPYELVRGVVATLRKWRHHSGVS